MWYRGIRMTYNDLSVSLRGDHQLFNAALALCTLERPDRGRFPRERVRGQERGSRP